MRRFSASAAAAISIRCFSISCGASCSFARRATSCSRGQQNGFAGLGVGDLGAALGFGLDFAEFRLRRRHQRSGFIFACHGGGFGLGDLDALLLLGLLLRGDSFRCAGGSSDFLIALRLHFAGDGLGLQRGQRDALAEFSLLAAFGGCG